MHVSKISDLRSSAVSGILTFVSHCSANFRPMLDCFIPNFKLKYEGLENIKADCVSFRVNYFNNYCLWVELALGPQSPNLWLSVKAINSSELNLCDFSFLCIIQGFEII